MPDEGVEPTPLAYQANALTTELIGRKTKMYVDDRREDIGKCGKSGGTAIRTRVVGLKIHRSNQLSYAPVNKKLS